MAQVQCAICLDDISEKSIALPCAHIFHQDCIDEWKGGTCPICRYVYAEPTLVEIDFSEFDLYTSELLERQLNREIWAGIERSGVYYTYSPESESSDDEYEYETYEQKEQRRIQLEANV